MQPTNQNQLPLNYYISVYLSTGCLPDLIVRTSCMFNFYLTEKIKMSVFIQLLIRGLNFFSISTIQLVRESSSLLPLEFFECIICRFYIHKTFLHPFSTHFALGQIYLFLLNSEISTFVFMLKQLNFVPKNSVPIQILLTL